MHQFVETICIENGNVKNLALHEERLNHTRALAFGCNQGIHLANYINIDPQKMKGQWKLRIVYGENIEAIEFAPYEMRHVNSLQLVMDDNIDYSLKSTNRDAINLLFAQRQDASDVLIVKQGLITDTSICNVALHKDGKWFTPKSPLLLGTQRQRLIADTKIMPTDIPLNELHLYNKISLFNALIPFEKIVFPIDNKHILNLDELTSI